MDRHRLRNRPSPPTSPLKPATLVLIETINPNLPGMKNFFAFV